MVVVVDVCSDVTSTVGTMKVGFAGSEHVAFGWLLGKKKAWVTKRDVSSDSSRCNPPFQTWPTMLPR